MRNKFCVNIDFFCCTKEQKIGWTEWHWTLKNVGKTIELKEESSMNQVYSGGSNQNQVTLIISFLNQGSMEFEAPDLKAYKNYEI